MEKERKRENLHTMDTYQRPLINWLELATNPHQYRSREPLVQIIGQTSLSNNEFIIEKQFIMRETLEPSEPSITQW